MRKRLAVIVTVLGLVCPFAASEGVVHTNILKLRFGANYQLDTYLSPMAYNGLQVSIGNEWWQPFRAQDDETAQQSAGWAHVGRLDVRGVSLYNYARTNRIYGFGITGGWGGFYCWRWVDNRLKLLLGPYLETELNVRNISSNVNKPLSLDLSAEIMAMTGLSWSFYGKKTSYRLNYQLRTNLIGFDYLPDYWQSYYEISQGVRGMPRCSGHWNHHTVKHELTLDMQFPHSTWRVGAEHEYLNYGTRDLHFVRNQVSLVIGCIWNYRIKANTRL